MNKRKTVPVIMTHTTLLQSSTPRPWAAEIVHPDWPHVDVRYVHGAKAGDYYGGEICTLYNNRTSPDSLLIARAVNAFEPMILALEEQCEKCDKAGGEQCNDCPSHIALALAYGERQV